MPKKLVNFYEKVWRHAPESIVHFYTLCTQVKPINTALEFSFKF